MGQKDTEIIVLNRAGKQKAKFTFASDETLADLKRQIVAQANVALERQYLTLGQPSNDPKVKKVVLDDDDKKLRDLPLSTNDYTVTLKDLGPQVSWRTVFLVEYGGPLVIFILSYLVAKAVKGELSHVQNLATFLVAVHYIKRELETVFVHIFSHGTMPIRNIFKNSLHYWILCGVCISGELFFTSSSKDASYSTSTQYILAGLFLLFEFLNLQCHITLRNLRTGKGDDKKNAHKKRGIPRGWGFDLVSCANYFWETCVWVSFAALTRCWSSYVFLFVSFAQMTQWALKKHRQYRKEFDGKEGREAYPRGRKAIVPFVL